MSARRASRDREDPKLDLGQALSPLVGEYSVESSTFVGRKQTNTLFGRQDHLRSTGRTFPTYMMTVVMKGTIHPEVHSETASTAKLNQEMLSTRENLFNFIIVIDDEGSGRVGRRRWARGLVPVNVAKDSVPACGGYHLRAFRLIPVKSKPLG